MVEKTRSYRLEQIRCLFDEVRVSGERSNILNFLRCVLPVSGAWKKGFSLASGQAARARTGAARSHGKVSCSSKKGEQFRARFSEMAAGDRFSLRSGAGLAFGARCGGQWVVLLASLGSLYFSHQELSNEPKIFKIGEVEPKLCWKLSAHFRDGHKYWGSKKVMDSKGLNNIRPCLYRTFFRKVISQMLPWVRSQQHSGPVSNNWTANLHRWLLQLHHRSYHGKLSPASLLGWVTRDGHHFLHAGAGDSRALAGKQF